MAGGPGPQAGTVFIKNPNPGDGRVDFASDVGYLDNINNGIIGQSMPDFVVNASVNDIVGNNAAVTGSGAGPSTAPSRAMMNTQLNVSLHNPAVQGQQGSPALTQPPVIAGLNPGAVQWNGNVNSAVPHS